MSQPSAIINVTPSKAVREAPTPDMVAVMRATKSELLERDFKYIDDFGFRKLGDPLIDIHREAEVWSTPQDIEIILFCPADIGQHITYAEIKVEPSSDNHETRVIGGGIGMDHIRISVKANNSYWLRYQSRIYGSQTESTDIGKCQ